MSADVELAPVERERRVELLRQMVLLRRFEERCVALYGEGHIRGFLHLYDGEEAVAVGVSRCLGPDDAVVATYREHGQALARGVSPRSVMAELFGRREGCSGGRGGSMHLFDAQRRFFGGNAIVGGGIPVAVGLALADRHLQRGRVTACFFGEGAVDEGAFHESMNLAALWRLPVLFVCENNLYSMGTALAAAEADTDLCEKARSYRVDARAVDGMDVLAVIDATRAALEVVRSGRPAFIEARTYRFRAHSMFDAQLYRSKDEVAVWRARDPLRVLREQTPALTDDVVHALEAEADHVIDDAVAFAFAGTDEDPSSLLSDVVGPPPAPEQAAAIAATTVPVATTYRECVRDALRACLRDVPGCFLMGEDVGAYGGCYAVTKGLLAEFGPERVRDTPLSELAFVGAGVGAAIGGARPIVEVMTGNFALLALDQLVNNAATLRHMSGGQVRVPLVVRLATGAGRQLAAQHSHSFEGWLAHVPGLRILAPATLADARGMLPTALRSEDPVLIFEHVGLYNAAGSLAADAGAVDITRAAVRRSGDDVALITSGGSLPKCLAAASALAERGIEATVLDLRVLRPLDDAAIADVVRCTHRVVVVDEGWRGGGLAAEVIARIGELCFDELDAPPARVCTAEVPIPYARRLEEAALPSVERIVAAAVALVPHG